MAKFGDGAAPAIERILSAYGLSSQKELGEKLGIYANNISSWLARDSVPGNVFVECAIETGADIGWLVTGNLQKQTHPVRPSRGKRCMKRSWLPVVNLF